VDKQLTPLSEAINKFGTNSTPAKLVVFFLAISPLLIYNLIRLCWINIFSLENYDDNLPECSFNALGD
jgi:hypothetical protein